MAVHPSTHPSADILKAFCLGKPDDGSFDEVLNHLEQCEACRKDVTAQTSDDFLARLRQARGREATASPGQTFAEAAPSAQPPLAPITLPNVPPELANHPDYELLRELGRGGMGIVYLARHRLSGRQEVLKVMNKALIGQASGRERFLREIQSAARLDHKNIVKMYTALERGELMVLVMEYVPGEDLAQVLKSRGPLPVSNACYYVQQAASGLQHAFEKGMVHRDVKPQNLMLARDGRKHLVKVLDFGLAKAVHGDDVKTELTGTGAMMGTPGYVAPEQSLDAATADVRADIYSLGCTLYHLLAGVPPFTGKSLFEILQAHHAGEARPLNEVRPEVPEALAAVVRKMMVKDRKQRYQTPAEIVKALEPFVKGTLKPFSSPVLPQVGPQAAAVPLLQAQTVIAERTPAARDRSKPMPVKRGARDADAAEASSRSLWKGFLLGCAVVVAVSLMLGLGSWAGWRWFTKEPESTTETAAEDNATLHKEQSANNLKMMALAMHNYNSVYNQFPPAGIGIRPSKFKEDVPKANLSWRVAILPFVEHTQLYNQFKLDEPWDGPNNMRLLQQMPKIYKLPGDDNTPPDHTHYQVFVGNGAAFDRTIGARFPASFPDGTSNTILIAEVEKAVPWTKPEDVSFDPLRSMLPLMSKHFPGGFHVALADGSTRFLTPQLTETTFKNAITPADGLVLGPDW